MTAHPLRLVMAVALILGALGIDHGLPHRFVPDDHAVTAALAIARDVADGGGLAALVPPAGRDTTYPYLLPYLNLGAIGVSFAVGRVTGAWGGPGEFVDTMFEDATPAWLPARLVVLLVSLLLPWASYRAARELGSGRGRAALAALLATSSLLFVQYAHTTRPWAPVTAFTATCWALTLRARRHRERRGPAFAAFAAAALAAAAHPVGLLAFGLPVLAALLGWIRPAALGLGAVLGAVVALALGYPYVVVHGGASGAGAIAGAEAEVVQIGGQAFDVALFHGARLAETARAWFGYDPLLVTVGVLGVLGGVLGTRRRASWMLGLPPAVLIAAFLLYDGTHVRYLLPAVPWLAVGASRLLGAAFDRGGAARLVALLLVALPLAQALRFDLLLLRDDTREVAARELPELIDPDETVAVDHFGSQYGPPLRASGTALTRWVEAMVAHGERGLVLAPSRREQRWLALHEAGVPDPPEARHVLPVSRFWIYDSYYPTDYELTEAPLSFGAWLEQWDVDLYVQVDRVPDAERRRPVTDELARRGTLLWECSPTGASGPRRAELPTDMAFALTELWLYERPGPWIRCWRLDAEGGR